MSKGKKSGGSRGSKDSALPRAAEVEGEWRATADWLPPLLGGLDAATETSRIMTGLAGDPASAPLLRDQPPDLALKELADGLNCTDIQTNLCSWWKMDWWSAVCREARRLGVSHDNQRVILQWLQYILKWISVDGLEREEMFVDVIEAMRFIARSYHTGDTLPLPKDIFRQISLTVKSSTYEVFEESKTETGEEKSQTSRSIGSKSFRSRGHMERPVESSNPEQDTKELVFLVRTIYDMFGNKFMYEAIRSAYTNPPEIIPVTIVETLQVPKTLKLPEKKVDSEPKAGVKKKASVVSKPTKKSVGTKAKKSVTEPTAPARQPSFLKEDVQAKFLQEDLKEKTKNDYLLSLGDSVDKKFFERLFPAKVDKAKKGVDDTTSKRSVRK